MASLQTCKPPPNTSASDVLSLETGNMITKKKRSGDGRLESYAETKVSGVLGQ